MKIFFMILVIVSIFLGCYVTQEYDDSKNSIIKSDIDVSVYVKKVRYYKASHSCKMWVTIRNKTSEAISLKNSMFKVFTGTASYKKDSDRYQLENPYDKVHRYGDVYQAENSVNLVIPAKKSEDVTVMFSKHPDIEGYFKRQSSGGFVSLGLVLYVDGITDNDNKKHDLKTWLRMERRLPSSRNVGETIKEIALFPIRLPSALLMGSAAIMLAPIFIPFIIPALFIN